MAVPPYDLLRHFRLLLWNRWTEFNETWQRQDLSILFQACVFRADQKYKMSALASDWLRHFQLLLWHRWTEFNETLQKASSQRPLPSLCFFELIQKQYGRPGLRLAETYFDFSSETAERYSAKLGRKVNKNCHPRDVEIFLDMPVIWTDFENLVSPNNEICSRNFNFLLVQMKFSQSNPSVWHFSTSLPPWPIHKKGGTLYSGARYVALWASCWLIII